MDEKFQKLKKVVGIVFKQMRRPFVMMLLIISSIIALIAGMIYFISTDDATYKEGDDKNVPYAVEQHTSDVTIDGNGNITTSKTAKELWDEMVKNGSRVNEYLDGPEELLKMMNAEMITNYLDTRKDPTEPIDWKKINRDVNSKTVQGIIKLKRAFDNGKTSIITYTDPATFQMYIDNYNASGSEEDKQKALSHFTLEKGYSNSASFGTGAAITAGTTINIPAGLGSVHTYMGWQCITATSSMQYKLREQAGMNFDSEGFGRINGRYVIACTTTFGQVGDYIDFYQEDGTVIQCIIGDIKNQNDAGCNEWGHLNGTCIIEFVVDKDSWYPSNHSNPGQEGFHMEWNQNLTKAINGGSYFNNPTFGSGTITGNGNTVSGGGTTAVSKWSYSEKSLNNALKHFANENNVAQGICVAGEYIILAQTPHETPRVDIYKLSTGKRVSSQVLNIGHGNSLTYNSRTGEVLSCSGGKVYVMSFDSSKAQLSIKKTITISGEATGAYGITYVSNDGYYYLRKGSYIYKTKDFKTITKAFKYNKTIRTQGLASDGTNIYVMGGDHYDGVIYTYTTSGKLINTYKITNQYEVEELDFYGNKMYISIHGKSNSGGIYYVEGQIGTTTGGNSTGVGNTIGGDLMKWPTDGTNITSYFGLRDAPTAGASTNHGAIDIGVPTGTNVYATEAGTVTTACWSDSAGNMVVIDHGNGYISKYMHNSALKVSAGEKVTKGQIIALAGSTGISTGPHVHFQIEYNGVKIDPLTFKYDNGMGNGTGGIGSNSNSLSTTNTIYAKVATWNEATDIVSSNDPSVENYSTTRYSMSATNVNYQELVKGYKMPFDYLWALLVIGQEKDFIFDLADLVYDSEIEITVHDNLTTNKNVSVDKYTKKTKVITENVNVKVNYSDKTTNYDNWDTEKQHPYETTTNGTATEIGGPFEKESKATYQKTHTIITKTNTLDVNVTKANVWIVDYSQEYTYQTPGAEVTNSSIPYNDEEYPETPSMTDGSDGAGLGENYRQSIQEQYAASHTTATATIESMNSRYYYKTVNRTVNITNTSTSKKYVASPAKIEEKTDRQSKEPNFVTLFLKHRKFQNNIKSATDWLFEVLEKGKNTVDMVDLTKYLLYKATGKDYGVTEFDFSIFQFNQVSSITGNIGWNWTCAHENYALWAYCHGKTGNYSQYYVKNYITADKSLYYMKGDSTSNDSRNYGYGVCIYVNGTYMQHTFPNYGIDITDAQYQNFGTSTLPVEIVDNVSRDIWMSNREDVIKTIQRLGYNESDFESYQIDCLTDIRYQGWSIKNAIITYMQKGLCDDVYYSCKGFYAPVPGSSQKHSRGEDRWILFSQGRYIISDTNGTVLDELSTSDFSGSGNFSVDTVTAGGYTYPHYLQKDYPGAYGTSTIPRSGCGPTSLAMILAGLKSDETITPITVVANINAYWPSGSYYVPGVGSSHCIFGNTFLQKYYGVSSQYGISQSAALSALEQGYPVIGSETGHILAIIPAPDEYKKQGYKFYIMDSARGHDGPYRSVAEANQVVKGSLSFLAIIKP